MSSTLTSCNDEHINALVIIIILKRAILHCESFFFWCFKYMLTLIVLFPKCVKVFTAWYYYFYLRKSIRVLPPPPKAASVPYGVTVAEVQRGDDLSEELAGLFGCEPALLHQVVKQLAARHVLQHQVPGPDGHADRERDRREERARQAKREEREERKRDNTNKFMT